MASPDAEAGRVLLQQALSGEGGKQEAVAGKTTAVIAEGAMPRKTVPPAPIQLKGGAGKRVTKEINAWDIKDPEPMLGQLVVTQACPIELACSMLGPPGTPYEGGTFHLLILVPEAYPFRPPKVRFTTKIFHPNVTPDFVVDGDITWCKPDWNPYLKIKDLLRGVYEYLLEPNFSDFLNPEVARVWRADRAAFETTAREWTHRFAGGAAPKESQDDAKDGKGDGTDAAKSAARSAAEPLPFKVHVRGMMDEVYSLDVEPTDDIEKVKRTAFDAVRDTYCDVPFEAWRLIFAAHTLEAGRTLSDYNIQSGSTLHLVYSITPGG